MYGPSNRMSNCDALSANHSMYVSGRSTVGSGYQAVAVEN